MKNHSGIPHNCNHFTGPKGGKSHRVKKVKVKRVHKNKYEKEKNRK